MSGKGCFSSTNNIDPTSGCGSSVVNGYKGGCKYCYGYYYNQNKFSQKICDAKQLDKEWNKRNNTNNNIRIGKSVDPGFSNFIELEVLLNWIKSVKARPILVTKKPNELYYKIYKLIADSYGICHISIGYDLLEPGLPENNIRIDVGTQLIKDGFPVIFRLVKEVTQSMDYNSLILLNKFGPDKILLTPLRLKSKNMIQFLGGDINKYDFYKGFYRPWDFHSDYKNLNTCLDGSRETYCAKCLL